MRFFFLGSFFNVERKETDVINARYDIMVTNIFSLPGKEDFTIKRNDVCRSSRSVLLSNHVGLPRQHQEKKTQNYLQHRSASTLRVNNFFQTAFLFIKKQTNIQVPHPGRFYVQEKDKMNNQTNRQEYCRYRSANHHTSHKVNKILKNNFNRLIIHSQMVDIILIIHI